MRGGARISPVRLKLKRTDICIHRRASVIRGGSRHLRNDQKQSSSELNRPPGARPASPTRLLMLTRRLSPIDGMFGTQGQGSYTPQNDGLHGVRSNTLHGALGLSGSTAAT